MKKVLVPLAEGFEEIEATCIIDVLRRAELQVVSAALGKKSVMGAHGITVVADVLLEHCLSEEFDAIVLPGGMPGSFHLKNSLLLKELLKDMNRKGKILGAICAAPQVLEAAGVLKTKHATCYPGVERELGKAKFSQDAVVEDGNIITSRGVGTALYFALRLVARLVDESTANNLKKTMLIV